MKVIKSDHFKKLGGAKSLGAPCPGMQKRAHPLQPPAPRGQGVQGVSNGKVMIVAHTQVGPEIKIFPLGSPNKFWGANFSSGAGQPTPPQACG